jgi:hypothetical protein
VTYLAICCTDFIIAPIWFNLEIKYFCLDLLKEHAVLMIEKRGATCGILPWSPLTLINGGIFHLSFGAILGATAWNRHKENDENGNGNGG